MNATLRDLLPNAAHGDYAIAGFNVFSIEWARAIIMAAEQCNMPVIIMCNRAMVAHIRPKFSGPLFRDMAERASVPVCVHLDHCTDDTVIQEAIDYGFSSVMYDGSALPLEENIAHTNIICEMAHAKGVSVEGEVGTVRYTDMPSTTTNYTDETEALEYATQTSVDALAVSVGSTHRMTEVGAQIQYDRLESIEAQVDVPLVIHGASGISPQDIQIMKTHRIAKFNIGTIMRQTFSHALRHTLEEYPDMFDIFEMTQAPYQAVSNKAEEIIKQLS